MSEQDTRPGLDRATSEDSGLSGSSFLPIIHDDAKENRDPTSSFKPTTPENLSVLPLNIRGSSETRGPKQASSSVHSISHSFIVSHYEDDEDGNELSSEFLAQHVEDSLKEAMGTPLKSPGVSESENVNPARPRPLSLADTEPFPDLEDDGVDRSDVYTAQEEAYSYALAKVAEEFRRLHEIEDNLAAIRGPVLLTGGDDTLAVCELRLSIPEVPPCLEVSHYDHYCEDHEASKIAIRQKVADFLFKNEEVPKGFRKRFVRVSNMVIEIEHIFFRGKGWPRDPMPLITNDELRAVRYFATETIKYLSTLSGIIFRERDSAVEARFLVAEVADSGLPVGEVFKRMVEIVVEPQRFLIQVPFIERTFFDLFFSFYDIFLYDDFHVMYNNYLVENMPNVSPRLRQVSYLLNTIYSIISNTVKDYKDMCEINKDIGHRFIQPVLDQLAQATGPSDLALEAEVDEDSVAQCDSKEDLEAKDSQSQTHVEVEVSAGVDKVQPNSDGALISPPYSRAPPWAIAPFAGRRRVGNTYQRHGTLFNHTNTDETSSLAVNYDESHNISEASQQDANFPSLSSRIMSLDGPSFEPYTPVDQYQGPSEQHSYDSDGGDTEVMSNSDFNRAWAQAKFDEAARERAWAEKAYAERVNARPRETAVDQNDVEDVRSRVESYSFQSSNTMDHEASHISAATSHTLDFEGNDAAISSAEEHALTTVVDPIHANMIEDYFKDVKGPVYSSQIEIDNEEMHSPTQQVNESHEHGEPSNDVRDPMDAEFDFLDLNNQEDEWLPHDWDCDHDRLTAPGYTSYAPNISGDNEAGFVSVKTFAARLEEMAQARMYQNIQAAHSRNRSGTSTYAQYNTPCFAASHASSTASEEIRPGYSQYYLPPVEKTTKTNTNKSTTKDDYNRDGAHSPLLPPLPTYPDYGRRVSDIEAERERARERDRERARRAAAETCPHPDITNRTRRPVGITSSPQEAPFSASDTEIDMSIDSDSSNGFDTNHRDIAARTNRLREMPQHMNAEELDMFIRIQPASLLFPEYRSQRQMAELEREQAEREAEEQAARTRARQNSSSFRTRPRFSFGRLARAVLPNKLHSSGSSGSSGGGRDREMQEYPVSVSRSREERSWGRGRW
ncbi:hypothetical protein BDV19DRAFT_331773 [Aspergillus venezuelensis]